MAQIVAGRMGQVAATMGLALSLTGGEAGAQATPASQVETAAQEQVDYTWKIRPIGEEPVELGAYRGKVVFINAWASWCVPCIREMASIQRLANLLADTEVVFLLVAVEGESAVRRHLRRYPLALPVFLEEEPFPRAFGLRGIPMSWIVDGQGRIALRHFGAAEWDSPAVETLLREMERARAASRSNGG